MSTQVLGKHGAFEFMLTDSVYGTPKVFAPWLPTRRQAEENTTFEQEGY